MPDAESGESVGIRIGRADIIEWASQAALFFGMNGKDARFDTGGSSIELIQPRAPPAGGVELLHRFLVRLFGHITDIALWIDSRTWRDIRQHITQVGNLNVREFRHYSSAHLDHSPSRYPSWCKHGPFAFLLRARPRDATPCAERGSP